MAGNIIPVVSTPKGQFICVYNGLPIPDVKTVKLPVQEHPMMESTPGGRASPIFTPSGRTTWDDLEITTYQNAPAGPLPHPFFLWMEACLNPETGFGLPVVAQSQIIVVTEQDGAGIPVRIHTFIARPYKRDEGTLEGDSDDPKEVTYSFKVQYHRPV